MKIALVQDWLTEMGGAEKVFVSLLNIFPYADVYTLTSHNRVIDRLPIKGKLNESYISKLPFGRTKYRNYLQFFPKAIESFDLSSYDLVISSSYSVAKGVITNSNQLHICYCHSPVRYAWDLYYQYIKESKLDTFSIKGLYARHVLHKLRIWDIISSNRVDCFIANSEYIKKRIEKVYKRNSIVIYPPVNISRFQLKKDKEDYYFTASRLVPYKKIDLIVSAFSKMPDRKLIVAGVGPELKKIKAINATNVELIGYVADDRMVELMQNAKAFVFAADEDFGIVPVEAQACGTPVICLGRGGTKETVIDGVTGVYFFEQNTHCIIDAVLRFESQTFNPQTLRENAERFSESVFEDKLLKLVHEEMMKYHKK